MTQESCTYTPSPDSLPCGLLAIDSADCILWCNATLAGWLGRTVLQVTGPWRALLTPASDADHPVHWQAGLQGLGALSEIRLELRAGETGSMPVVMTAARRAGADGGWIDMVFQPDYQRLTQAQELNESRDELRLLVHEATRLEADAQDRALFAEQMVGIVSHDLRNPLQAIHMGVLALARGTLTTNQIRVLGRVSRSTERAHRLIADLLDFTAARVGSGLSISRQSIDLGHVLSDAVEELGLAFPDRELLHRHTDDGPCVADPDRLSQLVGNLVANAMTYGDPDRAVSVTSAVAHGEVRIAVHNWGRPIPPERIDKIFEPMVRGDAKGQSRSVGLGLYIVCEIVKAHGGDIHVESTLEAGTTFTAAFASGQD